VKTKNVTKEMTRKEKFWSKTNRLQHCCSTFRVAKRFATDRFSPYFWP